MTTRKVCIDCAAMPDDQRPAKPRPTDGAPRKPRCASHRRAERLRAAAARHDSYVASTYGVSPGFYARMYAAQGGRCAICRRATGRAKRLAVDHDHRLTGEASVRGLLCGPCNDVLAHARSDPEMLRRAARYLEDPPAQRVLVGMDDDHEESA